MNITIDKFQAELNKLIGRLAHCKNTGQLRTALQNELKRINPDRKMSVGTKSLLAGLDISEGINAANRAIKGDPDALDD